MGKAPPPEEWILLGFMDRFGAIATFGRQPTPREMRRMSIVENVISAVRSRERAKDKVKWQKDNPNDAQIWLSGWEAWQVTQS